MVGITHCPSRLLRSGRVRRPRLMNKTIPLSYTSALIHASVEILSPSLSEGQNERRRARCAGASSDNYIFHTVSSSCTRLSWGQKIHRNEEQAEIYSGTNAVCQRCNDSPTTSGQMFWLCNSLGKFWATVLEAVSHICGRTVSQCPVFAVFGVSPSGEQLSLRRTWNTDGFL